MGNISHSRNQSESINTFEASYDNLYVNYNNLPISLGGGHF